MNEHLQFMAQHVIEQLNKLGIIKDAQVNSTVKRSVATFMSDYLKGQKVELILSCEAATIRDNATKLTTLMSAIGDVANFEEALEAVKTLHDMADANDAAEEARVAERKAGWDPRP